MNLDYYGDLGYNTRMAYEVTATRRRPQKFEDLIGQEFVAATLKNSIESGKIAHAYLFSGPRGCGKTSTARIMAKALNCQNGPTVSPCGTCSTCVEITKGSSLDVIEIDGASNTSVNDIRQIIDEVMFPPNSCRYKIYIIDEVHMLSTSAFNALLKTIEEPPPYVIFIFATTELQKVPATIKSRCQQFMFRLVPIEKVKEQLALACQDIGITADDEALYWVARESTGSMRDAYTLFDQVAAFSEGHLTYEKIRDKLGLVGTERLNEIFDDCVAANQEAVIEKLASFLESGISIEQLITNSSDYLRSLLLIKSGITKESLLGQAPERYSKNVISAWNSVQIERALSIFLNLYRDIRYSLSPRYEIELAFSKLCWLKDYVSPQELKKAIDSAHSLLMQGSSNSSGQNLNSTRTENAPVKPAPVVEQKAPAGFSDSKPMATFAGLSDSGQSNSEIPQEQGENPFYDGGALPPKTTAAAAVTDDNFSDFTASPSAQVEFNSEPVSQDGLSLEAVKGKTIATLSVEDAFISAALMQTGPWEMKDGEITTTVDSSFQESQLNTKSHEIAECIANIIGQNISFKAVWKQPVEHKEQVVIPEQVNILCKAFKGDIVGGAK